MAGIDNINVKDLSIDVIGQRNSMQVSDQTLNILYKEKNKAVLNGNLIALYQQENCLNVNMPLNCQILYTPGNTLYVLPGQFKLVALVTNVQHTVDTKFDGKRVIDNTPIAEGFTTTSQGNILYNPGNATAFTVPSEEGDYKINTGAAYSKHGQALSFRDNPSISLGENITEVFLSCNIYMSDASSFGIYAGTIDNEHGLTVTNGEISQANFLDKDFPRNAIVPVKIHWSVDKRQYGDLGINGTLTININGKNVLEKNNVDISSTSLSNIVFTGSYDKVWVSDILVTSDNIIGREVYGNPEHIIIGKKQYNSIVNASTKRHLAGNINNNCDTLRKLVEVQTVNKNYDTRRVIGNTVDSYHTILRHIFSTVDTEFSTARVLYSGKQTVDDSFTMLRKIVLDIPADYDTVRKLTGNITADYDTRRSISGPVDLNWRMTRVIENGLFHICNFSFDTRREVISRPTPTEGYYECKEIDLGYEYYVGAALEIKGAGYAQIRYARNDHKYGNYEPYNPRFVTCRYIQVRLVVRETIEKAVATIVSPEQEINITKDIPKEGTTVSYGTRFYTVPSIFPSYTDKKVVVSNITTTSCFIKLTDENGNTVKGSVSLLIRG
jgi:hypothetical protein